MQFLILFLALIGFGLFLGLAYVGIRALIMATRGSVWAGKGLVKSASEGAKSGWSKQMAIEKERKERLRARS